VVVMDDLDPAGGVDPAKAPDATLKFDSALRGKIEAGTLVEFSGAPRTFAKDPFMIMLDVEKAKVKGLGDAGGRTR